MSGAISMGSIPAHLIMGLGPLDPFGEFLIADNFTDTDATQCSDHISDKRVGTNGWNSAVATYDINSNRVDASTTADGDEAYIETNVANHYAQASITGNNAEGVIVRFTDSNVYYLAHVVTLGGALDIYRNNSGFTAIQTNVVTWVDGDVLRLEAKPDGTLQAYQNDTAVGAALVDSDISTTATSVGIRSSFSDTASWLDTFRVGLSS